jgi:hypothetical protein
MPIYENVKAQAPSQFLWLSPVHGLDPHILEDIKRKPIEERNPSEQRVVLAEELGNRHALRADSLILVPMAILYLSLLINFRAVGGYRAVEPKSS